MAVAILAKVREIEVPRTTNFPKPGQPDYSIIHFHTVIQVV